MKCLVIGAGYAGIAHARAMKYHGLDVACLCARDEENLKDRAAELQIRHWSTDWKQAIEDHSPDIVCLATSANLRLEVIQFAAERGIQIFCDKPLGVNSIETETAVKVTSHVKTSFAATRRYDHSVQHLKSLIKSGRYGQIKSATYRIRACMARPIPAFWATRLETGGGILNNHFPHVFSILETVFDGRITTATGVAKFEIDSTPNLGPIHNFQEINHLIAELESGMHSNAPLVSSNIDTSYTAHLQLESPNGSLEIMVESSLDVPEDEVGLTLQTETGAHLIPSGNSFQIDLPKPSTPLIDGSIADRYACLARDFLNDITDQEFEPYYTFQDGHRCQQLIKAIRGF